MTEEKGYVSEIFASVQGEGILVGERQIFVRMAGCSAACRWCDTASSKERHPNCVVRAARKKSLENPITVGEAVAEVVGLIAESGPVRAVSLTGGEPLEQAVFVGGLAGELRDRGCRVYLDTNGLEAEEIGKVAACVDVVAMDIKLPSATGKPHWEAHRAFLRALRGADVFVKIVVDPATPLEELDEAVRLIAEHDARIPLVLQPESAAISGTAGGAAAAKRLASLVDRAQRRALERLDDVRVIPQCHKLLKIR